MKLRQSLEIPKIKLLEIDENSVLEQTETKVGGVTSNL